MIYPADKYEHKTGMSHVRSAIKAFCLSRQGAAWVDEMSFSNDFEIVDRLLRSTHEMLAIQASDTPLTLSPDVDILDSLARLRIEGTVLSVQELPPLGKALQSVIEVDKVLRSDEARRTYPQLALIAEPLMPAPKVVAGVNRVVDEHGNVRDNASPTLATIRRELSSVSGTINAIMRRVMSRAVAEGYIDQDVTPSVRDGRLVLPIAPAHKRSLRGIVHDESASGKTVYIEPAEVVEANNRTRELQMEERREINRILLAFADALRPILPTIRESLAIMAHLDFIRAKALYASAIEAHLPALYPDPQMEWFHATHPVLLETLRRQGKEIVPLDIRLTEADRMLIISGPNAGGKSVCLSTVGIIQYMIQCGILPPMHANSHAGIFDNIFLDMGDDQSLEDDLSTYSSHLKNMKFFLARGNSRTLALIDEFGSGTEPTIGAAIAQSILTSFVDKKMWGVINTHFQNLKQMAEETPGLINGSMLYDRHLMQPLFKLSIGSPGSSFALEIARKIGLPESILDRAGEIVGSDYINIDRYLLDIARDKRYWENKRLSIKAKEKKIDSVLASYEEAADTLRASRKEIIADARAQAQQIIDSSNAAIERTIHEIRRAQADKELTRSAREALKASRESITNDHAEKHPLLERAPRSRKPRKEAPAPKVEAPLAEGDYVKLDGQGEPGKIITINGKQASVAFGQLLVNVKLDRLKPTQGRPKKAKDSFISNSTTDSMRERQLNFKQEIDVRGMRADEAVQAVTYFIDDAIQFNAGRLRILHGTGTGALRQYIRRYLDTVPGVRSYQDEDVRFGGAGITIVNLE